MELNKIISQMKDGKDRICIWCNNESEYKIISDIFESQDFIIHTWKGHSKKISSYTFSNCITFDNINNQFLSFQDNSILFNRHHVVKFEDVIFKSVGK